MVTLESMQEFYEHFLPELLEADPVNCRGYNTKEILGVQFKLTNPRKRAVWIRGRMFNMPFAITEALMLISGTNKVKYTRKFNENVFQFSDDGEVLYGAYGYRIASYIPELIEKLKSDKTTRQALLTINRVEDNYTKTKDVPCTISLQFIVRDNKLHLFTYMRSNDAIWGTPYDVFVFTMLQEVIANTLDLDLGDYVHNVTSLHLYEHHFQAAKNTLSTLQASNADAYTACEELPIFIDYEQYKSIADLYMYAVDNDIAIGSTYRIDHEIWPLNMLAVAEWKSGNEWIKTLRLPATEMMELFLKDYYSLEKKRG